MNLHREVHFETAICEHLAAHGWRYAEGDTQHFDRVHGLYLPDDVLWQVYQANARRLFFGEELSQPPL